MGELVMKNRKRLLKTVGLLTAATVMTVSLNAESVLAYSTGEEAAIVASEEDPYDVTKINLKDMFNQNQEDYYVYFYMVQFYDFLFVIIFYYFV